MTDLDATPAGGPRGVEATAADALVETTVRLNALDEHLAYQVGVPDEPDWHRLGDLTDTALLTEWHAELSAREGDRRTAAAYLGGWVASAVVEAYLLPVLADARLPLADVAEVGVHRHANGWFDMLALPDAAIAVLPGDLTAASTGVRVLRDRSALLDAMAQRLTGIGAVFATVCAALPVGGAALWGGLADSIGGRSLWLARLCDLDRRQAWADAQTIMDRIATAGPQLRQRPAPFPVRFSGGEEWFSTRSTCCLYYRTVESPDPDGEGYCGTCPLRTDTSRTRRLRAHLDERAATI